MRCGRTVLETAERLVREEIDRIKREARCERTGPQTRPLIR